MPGKPVSQTALQMAIQMLPQDANPMGNVHGGVIMKHIDEAAGVVAMRHARRPSVTASLDRLDFHNPVLVGNLLILRASVNMVGRTSMELGVRVEAEDLRTGLVRHTASAYLTFVALDDNGRPTPVPPLILAGEEEQRRHQEALNRRQMRLAEKAREHKSAPRS